MSNLRIAAYETLMELIKNSPKDCYPVVQDTLVVVLNKLGDLLNKDNSFASASEKVRVDVTLDNAPSWKEKLIRLT